MGKIQILPEEIVSKIAAGEVIERPASVVKELIENSIDAGAKKIRVLLVNGGKNLIKVSDDGIGIEKDDLPLLFQRHSTSKIKSFDDIFRINSMGFRGEALYSIGSVSEIFLRSKTKKDDIGWQIHVKNGKKSDPKPIAMQQGTEIEVYNLFASIPARRKFLKSDSYEFRKILDTLIPYTLLHPEISFFLIHNEKTIFELYPEFSEKTRLSKVFNIQEQNLIEITWAAPDKSFFLKLVSGDINVQRPKKDVQFIFINNRPIQHNGLSFVVNDIYKKYLPSDTYPGFAIFIKIKRENVDVNVHPSKREVKIRNEVEVLNAVRTIIEENLSSKLKPVVISYQEKPESFLNQASETTQLYHQKNNDYQLLFDSDSQQLSQLEDFKKSFLQSRYIATVLSTYLLFEYKDRLFIVDQHAAHERIVFERLLFQIKNGKIKTHQLLIPVSISLTPTEMIVWNSGGKKKLEEIGFHSTQWDNKTIAIHCCPVGIKNPELAVRNILSHGNLSLDTEELLKRACRGSTMSGQQLSEEEAEKLKIQLTTCNNPFRCPHGRPTVIEIEKRFIDKQFLR
ncbi:MAG: DNA mismatch repair endonuclease MutL [Candidatus Omnitrophica bacterium]|nr:DNA mismatch repair endonuclease MutL [Candidatus Omnitrophota bacterium]MCM8816192.1 DNA mismatch repair endonuclease MutL [Candidatus Omnitrophota bacterium]